MTYPGTADLSIAAYMAHKGISLVEARALGDSVFFCFDIDQKQFLEKVIEFPSSEEAKFDWQLRALRKTIFSSDWPYERRQQSDWSTIDLSLAAFAMIRGARLSEIIRYQAPSEKRWFRLFFEGDHSLFDRIETDWPGSVCYRYDATVAKLKQMGRFRGNSCQAQMDR